MESSLKKEKKVSEERLTRLEMVASYAVVVARAKLM